MCADLRARLAVVVASAFLLASAPAQAQIPEASDPECVERYCSCEPGVGRPCDFDCASHCSGSSGESSSSGSSEGNGEIAPIFKLAAGVIVVGVVAGMFAVAPGHSFSLFKHRQSAKDAKEDWEEHQDALASLEREAGRLEREWKRLDESLRAARQPPVERIGGSYAPVDLRPAPDRWARQGTCGDLIEANDELLRQADQEATEQGWSFLPSREDLTNDAEQLARDALVGRAGPAKYAAQRAELLRIYEEAEEGAAFLEKMQACAQKPDLEANDCLNELLLSDPPAPLKALVEEALGEGLSSAIDRVRDGASFYRRTVRELEASLEKQALAATRCR